MHLAKFLCLQRPMAFSLSLSDRVETVSVENRPAQVWFGSRNPPQASIADAGSGVVDTLAAQVLFQT
jgi:hypothetical protein